MLEFVECFLDVTWHGKVTCSLLVVPCESDSAEQLAFPIDRTGVFLAEGIKQMVGIVLVDVFDSKVIHNEAEHDVSGCVLPKSGSVSARGISKRCEMFF